jgi:hypothetical protein
MASFDELLAIKWPSEFIVEYNNGARERILRGAGVLVTPPADDPEGIGFICADLPTKHTRNQKDCGRCIRFNVLRAISSAEGRRLWPDT